MPDPAPKPETDSAPDASPQAGTDTPAADEREAELNALCKEFAGRLASWVDRPGPEEAKVAELRAQIEAMEGAIGKAGVRQALDGLEGTGQLARERRLREAAEAIRRAVRPVGVRLTAQSAAKKPGRKSPATPKS